MSLRNFAAYRYFFVAVAVAECLDIDLKCPRILARAFETYFSSLMVSCSNFLYAISESSTSSSDRVSALSGDRVSCSISRSMAPRARRLPSAPSVDYRTSTTRAMCLASRIAISIVQSGVIALVVEYDQMNASDTDASRFVIPSP